MDISSTIKMNDGFKIPALGLGVFQITENEDCMRAIRVAIDAGYRHIDTATIYKNEESVGQAIKESGIDRESIFVTTKCWISDFGKEKTRAAFETSLRKLDMDYIDLYLIHWPEDATMFEAWEVFQQLREEGKIRSIGVSNFTVRRFEESFLPKTDFIPAVNQIELHPFCSRPDVVDYCKSKNIVIESYSPLARAEKMNDPTLIEIASEYGKTVAQIILRWHLQRGFVLIPKSTNPQRIVENASIFDFELCEKTMARINALNRNEHVISWRPSENWY